MICACGHVDDEHRVRGQTTMHYAECTVDDCPCFLFEEDPDAMSG